MEEITQDSGKIGNEHLYDLLTSTEVSWQSIIYDLINTGQLDPWNIDLALLARNYLVKIKEMEEANFFVSSKVLLAASLLLRIKSEILLNDYIKSIDDILFGKKDVKKVYERIEIDENDLPILYPKTPMARMRKVSLEELMNHLEVEHDLVIPRNGENEDQAWERITVKGTRIGTPQCQCPMCKWNLRDSEITERLIKDGLVIEKNHMTYIKELNDIMVEFVLPFSKSVDGR